MALRVVHTSRSFYPVVGGVETYIWELAKRLVKKGVVNCVLSLNWDISAPKNKFALHDTHDGIIIDRIKGFGPIKKVIPLTIPLKTLGNADIVHIHDLRFLFETVLVFKHVFGYKIILSTHGFFFHTNYFATLKKLLFSSCYRPFFNNFIDAVICDGKQDWDFCKKMGIKNIHLIENGVDCDRFGVVQRKPVPGEYLYFGRIDQNKGIDNLFEVLSNCRKKPWRLNIVGNGRPEIITTLKDLASRLEISDRIVWHGFIQESALLNLLGTSQICFFPSSYEGFGFTLVEAMAAGCVCIAQNNSSYRTLVDNDKNAYLINFTNLAESVDFIENITERGSYHAVSEAAREKAQLFRWETKVDEIMAVYNSLL